MVVVEMAQLAVLVAAVVVGQVQHQALLAPMDIFLAQAEPEELAPHLTVNRVGLVVVVPVLQTLLQQQAAQVEVDLAAVAAAVEVGGRLE